MCPDLPRYAGSAVTFCMHKGAPGPRGGSTKNQITLPVDALRAAGLEPGDEVTTRPVGVAKS